MAEGGPPYCNRSLCEALDLIAANGTPEIPNPEGISAVFKDYLSSTLCVDVERRAAANALLQVRTICVHCYGYP
jgi:p21-activated kinase 1